MYLLAAVTALWGRRQIEIQITVRCGEHTTTASS